MWSAFFVGAVLLVTQHNASRDEMLKKLTSRMQQIAIANGMPEAKPGLQVRLFRRFLADTITEHGNMAAAAPALELEQSTLSRWCQLLEIERKTVRTTTAKVVATAPD